jgi:hypothetical protein
VVLYDDWADVALIGICSVSDFLPVALYSKQKIFDVLLARGLNEDDLRDYYLSRFVNIRAGEFTPVILADTE